MATSSKKTPAKVATKKVATSKPVKVAAPKPKAEKKSTVKFVSFTFGATIPTQPFGNVQPHIVVEAASYEEAAAFAMPKIEELYRKYSDNTPTVFTKVTETVKEVAPIAAPAPAQAPTQPQAQDVPAPVAQDVPAPVATAQAPSAAPESEFAARARKMIGLAMTEEAAQKIKTQVEGSEKIPAAEKPALLELVEAKITDFQSNIW